MKISKILTAYVFIFLIFTAFLFVFFNSPIYSSQPVLFYRGLIFLFTTSIITLIVSLFFNKFIFSIGRETLIAAIIISFSLHLSFFIVFPVTFDRSVTMYLLSALKEKPSSHLCQGLSEKDLENYLINEYIVKKKAVERRLTEQAIINNVKEENNCVELTPRGVSFLKLSKLIMKIYSQN